MEGQAVNDNESVASNSPALSVIGFLMVDGNEQEVLTSTERIREYFHAHQQEWIKHVDGIDFECAITREEALNRVQVRGTNFFNAVLLDGAKDAVTDLRNMLGYGVTIFGLSLEPEAAARLAFVEAGADGFVRKPLNDQSIGIVFEHLLNNI